MSGGGAEVRGVADGLEWLHGWLVGWLINDYHWSAKVVLLGLFIAALGLLWTIEWLSFFFLPCWRQPAIYAKTFLALRTPVGSPIRLSHVPFCQRIFLSLRLESVFSAHHL